MRYVKSGDSLATPKNSVLLYLDFYVHNRKKKKKKMIVSFANIILSDSPVSSNDYCKVICVLSRPMIFV